MEYYKNSMRYAKFTLFFVISLAISVTLFKGQIYKILNNQQQQELLSRQTVIQESLPEKNAQNDMQQQEIQEYEESEDEYTERIINERKQKNPDIIQDREAELRDAIRNQYRIEHNLEPVKPNYISQKEAQEVEETELNHNHNEDIKLNEIEKIPQEDIKEPIIEENVEKLKELP